MSGLSLFQNFKFDKKTQKSPTHTRFSGGSFFVSDADYDKFTTLYVTELMTGRMPELIEMPPKDGYNILLVDLDFYYKDNSDSLKHRYNEAFLIKVIKIYNSVMAKYITIQNYVAYVFERPSAYRKDNKIKDGIHIIFSGLRIHISILHQIRLDVMEQLEDIMKVYTDDEIDKIVDKSVVCQNGWFLYGSGKPGIGRYDLTYFYKDATMLAFTTKLTQFKSDDLYAFVNDFSLRRKRDNLTELELTELGKTVFNNYIANNKKKHAETIPVPLSNDDMDDITKLVSILGQSRSDNYKEWMEAGWCLKNLSNKENNATLYELWHNFSKKSHKYKESVCKTEWEKMAIKPPGEGLHMGTLHYWAKADNKDAYCEMEFNSNYKKILDYLHRGDIGLVEMYKLYFGDEIKYAGKTGGGGDGVFYMYNKTTLLWKEFDKEHIESHMGKKLPPILQKMFNLIEQKEHDEDKTELDARKATFKKLLSKSISFLQCASHLSSLNKLIKAEFDDPDFEKTLNIKRDTLSIQGGIINLTTGEFRPRTKEDAMTYELNIDWLGLDTDTSIIDEFIDGIFLGNKEAIEYIHKMLGYLITGETCEHKFFIFWGAGSNGKSVLMSLIKAVLEHLYYQGESELIIGNKKSHNKGAANSPIMKLEGKRLCCVDESNYNDKLSEGAIKNLTGGLEVTGRDLHEKTRSFTPYFKIVLLTNHKPVVSNDYAVERRLVLIPFSAKFVTNPTEPNDRLLDKHKGEMLMKNLDIFFVWLVKGCIKYYKDGLNEMPSVMAEAKKEYYQENDEIGEFIDACCDIKDSTVKTSTAELFECFKAYSGNHALSVRCFSSKIKDKKFEPTQIMKDGQNLRGFKGLALKN